MNEKSGSQQKISMQERRRSHRFNIELPIRYKKSATETRFQESATLNISSGGMCIVTKERLHVGQKVPLLITVSPSEEINVTAYVVWFDEILKEKGEGFKIGLKIVEPLGAGEERFVKFYAQKIRDHLAAPE